MIPSKLKRDMAKVGFSAFSGTSAMTLYSYIISRSEKKNFREPQLLNSMITNLDVGIQNPKIAGWVLHYKVGLGFALAYHSLWNQTLRPSTKSGIILGLISGLVGIAVWDTAMNKHPNPPDLDRKAFRQHLLFAHAVFGLFTALGYQATAKINM